MKEKLLILIFLITTAFKLLGQTSYSEFTAENDFNEKTRQGLYLINEYMRGDLDSLKLVSIELLLGASENDNKLGKAIGYKGLGSYLIRVEDIDKGIQHLFRAKKFFELKNDLTLLSETWTEIGNGYQLKGDFKRAINSYHKSLHYGKNAPDITEAYNSKLGLGKAYCAVGDTSLGLKTVVEYRDAAKAQKKYEATADAYAFLGMIEENRKNVSLSNEYFQESINFSKKSRSKIHLSHAYTNKAIVHFNYQEFDSSLYYFEKALSIRKQLNNVKGIVEGYFNLGNYYLELKDYNMAKVNYVKSVNLARKNGFVNDEVDALTDLQKVHIGLGDSREMASTTKRLTKIKSQIITDLSIEQEIIQYTTEVVEADSKGRQKNHENSKANYFWAAFALILTSLLVIRVFRK